MSVVSSLTILVCALSITACIAVFCQLRREKARCLYCAATLSLMVLLSLFLFREVAQLITGAPHQGFTPQSSLDVGAKLCLTSTILMTIVIIRQLLVRRYAVEEELRIRDAEMAQVSRVNTAGEMLGGLTHELSQPLTAISNYSAALRNALREEPGNTPGSMGDSNEKIRKEVSRAASILERVRHFLGKTEPQHSVVDMHELIHEAVELVEASGKFDKTKIELVLGAKERQVSCDPIEITQVIVNLVLNACEAFENVNDGECEVVLDSTVDRCKFVLSVTDNGPGLSTEVMGRMYDPFFTTKPNGMGMGLSICRTVLSRHGGDLSHVSAMPCGTTFIVSLLLTEINA